MFGLTLTELRLAAYAALLAAICASYIYTHHEGYEACKAPQESAQKAQKTSDTAIDQGVIREADQNKGSLTAPGGVAATPPPRIVVRYSSCVPEGPAPETAGPLAPSSGGSDSGVPRGAQAAASVDFGPIVQDLALAGVLRASQGDELWKRDVKQSQSSERRGRR